MEYSACAEPLRRAGLSAPAETLVRPPCESHRILSREMPAARNTRNQTVYILCPSGSRKAGTRCSDMWRGFQVTVPYIRPY